MKKYKWHNKSKELRQNTYKSSMSAFTIGVTKKNDLFLKDYKGQCLFANDNFGF
jgi:hypothetical protein